MERLTIGQKDKINKLYASGKSLNHLAMLLGKSKTTIYYHTRKNFGIRIKPIVFDIKSKKDFGEFIGAFAGDGGFYLDKKYRYLINFYLSANETAYAEHISRIIEHTFGKKPNILLYRKVNMIRVRIMGKKIYEILKTYLYWDKNKTLTIRLREVSMKMGNDFLKGIAAGLIATDGSVYVPRRWVSFATISKTLCLQLSAILKKFGIDNVIYPSKYNGKKTLYQLYIKGKNNLAKFEKKIGFTEPLRKSKLEAILKHQ